MLAPRQLRITSRFGRVGSLICLVWGALASPLEAQDKAQFSIQAGLGVRWFHSDAIVGLSNEFFQGRPVRAALGQVDPAGNSAISLNWRRSFRLTKTENLVMGVGLERGTARYFLPDGAGPFRDPITASATYVAITPTLGLERQLYAGSRVTLSTQAGLGLDWLHSQNTLTSALLDVRTNATFSSRFAYADIALRPSNTAAGFGVLGRLKTYGGDDIDVALSVIYQF